jgi:toxin ParE1/3/4
MSRQIFKSSVALQDLADCATYLGEQSPGLEARFLDAVEQTVDQIAELPAIGGFYDTQNPTLKDIRVWRVRGFEKFLIFYRLAESEIELVRVLHGARDIAAILTDE